MRRRDLRHDPAPATLRLGVALLVLALAACGSEPTRRPVARGRDEPVAPAAAGGFRADGATHTVGRGDTLYSIAFRNQLDYHDLADWNGIGRDYAIRVGQVLRLTPPGSIVPSARGSGPVVTVPAQKPVLSLPPVATAPADAPGRNRTAVPTPLPAGGPRASGAVGPARRIDDGTWEWPTRGKVVRSFGDDPSAKGIDIAGERGQMVIAARAGKVVYSGTALKGYGELIIIKHDEQYLSAYGYNRRRLVEEGDTVAAGQPIAEMGDGPEQRALLHYEVRDKGRPIDPRPLLPPR